MSDFVAGPYCGGVLIEKFIKDVFFSTGIHPAFIFRLRLTEQGSKVIELDVMVSERQYKYYDLGQPLGLERGSSVVPYNEKFSELDRLRRWRIASWEYFGVRG